MLLVSFIRQVPVNASSPSFPPFPSTPVQPFPRPQVSNLLFPLNSLLLFLYAISNGRRFVENIREVNNSTCQHICLIWFPMAPAKSYKVAKCPIRDGPNWDMHSGRRHVSLTMSWYARLYWSDKTTKIRTTTWKPIVC